MNIVIISSSHPRQQLYWQERFPLLQSFFGPDTLFLSVCEDWEGGAGNGWGTLYAYLKAKEQSKALYNIDLDAALQNGSSVALYHTAGQGKRIAPLVVCECGNKSAVKLPGYINSESEEILTLLEGVIKQTSPYVALFKGRLSVFWGDQIFIPSQMPKKSPESHLILFSSWEPMPDKTKWEQNKWNDYGIIVKNPHNLFQQMDKIEYPLLESLIHDQKIRTQEGIGLSLGSFSISFFLLQALLNEFQHELSHKKGQMDTDPDFWMATTLDKEQYAKQIIKKGKLSKEKIDQHHARMQSLLKKLLDRHPQTFLEPIDIGSNSFWWDYGTLKKYFINFLKTLQDDAEGLVMRKFYNLPNPNKDRSCILGSQIKKGKIENSILINVKAEELNVKNCVIINSSFTQLHAENALLYNVTEQRPLNLENAQVRADAYHPKSGEKISFYTQLEKDGKLDWSTQLPRNTHSYEMLMREYINHF